MQQSKQDKEFIAAHPLFAGLDREQCSALLESCGARVQSFHTGEIAVRQGDSLGEISLVISGCFEGVRYTSEGAVSQVAVLPAGEMFGELISGAESVSPVTVVAAEFSRALLIPFAGILTQSARNAGLSAQFMRNLMGEIAKKYFALLSRINVLTAGTLRRKICVWLCAQPATDGKTVKTALNREQLARYIGCERSALCRELSRMKNEGLIDYTKYIVTLLDRERLESAAE